MYKGNTKKIEHILHPLNLSRSKNSLTIIDTDYLFQGIIDNNLPMPHHPLSPAKNKPAPTKPDIRYNQGLINVPKMTPHKTNKPATI